MRKVMGLPRRDLYYNIPISAEAQSYHLTVTVPPRTHVYALKTRSIAFGPTARLPILSELKPFLTKEILTTTTRTSSLGLDYLHVYTRNPFIKSTNGGELRSGIGNYVLQVRAAYRETPPGSLAVMIPLAILLFVLSWVIGHYFDYAFPPHTLGNQPQTSASWPTIVFSLPALVAAWILARLTGEYLHRMSIASFFMVLWVVANAAGAVTLAALKQSGVSISSWTPISGFELKHVSWILLMVSTATSAYFMLVCFWIRTMQYWRLLAKRKENHL